MRWFRFYDEALDDPKVQRLPPTLFKSWVNVLCVASKSGGTIPRDADDLAFKLRIVADEAAMLIKALTNAELVDDDGETLRPHNWNGRQYESDSSTPRVKLHRKRKRNVSGNSDETVGETPPDTETEQTQNRKKDARTPAEGAFGVQAHAASNGTSKPDFRDPCVRKNAWETKVMNYLRNTLPTEKAVEIITAYGNGEPWAKARFDGADREMKIRKATS